MPPSDAPEGPLQRAAADGGDMPGGHAVQQNQVRGRWFAVLGVGWLQETSKQHRDGAPHFCDCRLKSFHVTDTLQPHPCSFLVLVKSLLQHGDAAACWC